MSTPQWREVGKVGFPFVVPFSYNGILAARPGRSRFPITGGPWNVVDVAAALNVAPEGGDVVLDVRVNGVSIYADQENRPRISADATLATVGAHTPTTVTDGDYLVVDIDEVGTTVPGADLVVTVRLQAT